MGVMHEPEHITWMREALDLARAAARAEEVPVGAIVVREGEVIGRGSNGQISRTDPTAHAEVIALRDAADRAGNYRLPGATLVVTVEPCTMCAGALVHARIETLVFGAREPRSGAIYSSANVLDNPGLNHRVQVIEGVMAEECGELMSSFFRERRS